MADIIYMGWLPPRTLPPSWSPMWIIFNIFCIIYCNTTFRTLGRFIKNLLQQGISQSWVGDIYREYPNHGWGIYTGNIPIMGGGYIQGISQSWVGDIYREYPNHGWGIYTVQLVITDTCVKRTLVQCGQLIPVSLTWNAVCLIRTLV